MKTISREELRSKMENGDEYVLVEVLGPQDYEAFHLPGAMNVPLDEDFAEKIVLAVPNKKETVVVYCRDDACTSSKRAAERLEGLGYERVLEYAAGKSDWRDAGLNVIERAS